MTLLNILIAAAMLSSPDKSYLTNAMQAELGRYALASAAEQHGSPSVKAFAKTLAAESAAQTRTLDAIAKSSNVAIPKQPLVRDAFHYTQLRGLSGSSFDRTFVMDVKIDDEMQLSREQSESRHGSDARLKALAAKRVKALNTEISKLGHLK